MKRTDLSIIGGLLLVAVGALLLAQTFQLMTFELAGLFGVLFTAGGILFLVWYSRERDQWWPLIPGFALLSIGVLLLLDWIAPRLMGALGGPIVLGGISLAFWWVYLTRRDQWWALIPAGTLLTLALATGLETAIGEGAFVGIFFLGLAATFALVYFTPRPEGRRVWPLIPAGVLAALGVIFLAAETSLFAFVWPVVLLLAGGYLLVRAVRRR